MTDRAFKSEWPVLVLQKTPSPIARLLLHLLTLLKHLVAMVNVEGSDGGDGVAVHLHSDVMVGGGQSSKAGESLQRHHSVLRTEAGGAQRERLNCSELLPFPPPAIDLSPAAGFSHQNAQTATNS